MWYILLMLVFALTLVFMLFAKDGFINSELDAYQKVLNNPWLEPIVALRYRTNQLF